MSDNQGRYFATELPIGAYEVEGKSSGFQTVVRKLGASCHGERAAMEGVHPVSVDVTGQIR